MIFSVDVLIYSYVQSVKDAYFDAYRSKRLIILKIQNLANKSKKKVHE